MKELAERLISSRINYNQLDFLKKERKRRRNETGTIWETKSENILDSQYLSGKIRFERDVFQLDAAEFSKFFIQGLMKQELIRYKWCNTKMQHFDTNVAFFFLT